MAPPLPACLPPDAWGMLVDATTGAVHVLTAREYIVGRNAALCNIVVDDARCSQRHCRVYAVFDDGPPSLSIPVDGAQHAAKRMRAAAPQTLRAPLATFVEDLDSANGTWVNGQLLKNGRCVIQNGDDIEIKLHRFLQNYTLVNTSSDFIFYSSCARDRTQGPHSYAVARSLLPSLAPNSSSTSSSGNHPASMSFSSSSSAVPATANSQQPLAPLVSSAFDANLVVTNSSPQSRYHIFHHATLGCGSYSTVMLAIDKTCGRRMAVKVFGAGSGGERSQQRDAVRKEAALLASIHHPNIVRVFDVVECFPHAKGKGVLGAANNTTATNALGHPASTHGMRPSYYVLLELIPGGDLFEHIQRQGNLREHEAKFIFYQILLALAHIHARGLVHRDLKPENVLLEAKKSFTRVILTDFGLAKYQHQGMKTQCGTLFYVAPEIINPRFQAASAGARHGRSSSSNNSSSSGRASSSGGNQNDQNNPSGQNNNQNDQNNAHTGNTEHSSRYTKAVDMWSLGVVLYVMLSGCTPFYAPTEVLDGDGPGAPDGNPPDEKAVVFDQICSKPVAFEGTAAWDAVSPLAKDMIVRLLERDPRKRLTTTQAMQHPWLKESIANLETIYQRTIAKSAWVNDSSGVTGVTIQPM